MRILLLGGFQYGHRLLEKLLARGESVVGVFLPKEDPHERTNFASRIESLCREHAIPESKAQDLNKRHAAEIANEFAPDVIFCFGWRTILRREILEVAPHGVIAAHHALLPRLRGFAPANWALLLAHDEIGTTLFRLTPGVDEGDIYFQESFPVTPNDTLASITDRQVLLSVSLFERYLDAVRAGSLQAVPQQHARATYCCARTPEDGEIDWLGSTDEIVRTVRALGSPAPGAHTYYNERILKIWKAAAVKNPPRYEGRIPGRVVARNSTTGTIDVLSGDGIVRIEEVEWDGLGECTPASIVKSVRTYLGVQATSEFAGLHRKLAGLEERIEGLEEKLASFQGQP